MKQSIKLLLGGALLLSLPMFLTSCEDILGEWDKPAPAPVAPSTEPETPSTTFEACLDVPLTFEAKVDGNISIVIDAGFVLANDFKYTKNGGAKTDVPATIAVSEGDVICFYGENTAYYDGLTYKGVHFSCDADTYVYGNLMSLIYNDDFEDKKTLTADCAFQRLFWHNDPPTDQNPHILNHPTKNIALPATTLTTNCYYGMFDGCSGLTRAPELPAPDISASCYDCMFLGCSSLNYIKCLATTGIDTGCASWVQYVSASGTFIKASGATGWTDGDDGIPTGWTVETE